MEDIYKLNTELQTMWAKLFSGSKSNNNNNDSEKIGGLFYSLKTMEEIQIGSKRINLYTQLVLHMLVSY